MNRPHVRHAGCGGEVERTAVVFNPASVILRCQKCQRQITDPMELAPRGTGHKPEPTPVVEWDRVQL